MKIAMIGAGQQGSSQGMGYIKAGHDVVFYDTNPVRQAELIQRAGEFDIPADAIKFASSAEEAMRDADVIGANVPGAAFSNVARDVGAFAKDGAVFYDNGSGKTQTMANITDALGDDLDRVHYVGAHFFVGKAGTGPAIATPEMYKNQTAAVMATDEGAQSIVTGLFEDLGAGNVRTDLSPEEHDASLGFFSHHNTFAVTALMTAFPDAKINGQNIQVGRFLSSTRVAAHGEDGDLFWGPIANDNADAIVRSAKLFSSKLDGIKAALQSKDDKALKGLFQQGADYIDGIAPDRKYEGLEGDLHDLDALGASQEQKAVYAGMPMVFGLASALSAKDYEDDGGQPFSSIGNSSFQDSLRPLRAVDTDYIWDNKDTMLQSIERLQQEHLRITDMIERHDSDAVVKLLKQSHTLRTQLPDAPGADDVRDEFVVGGPA